MPLGSRNPATIQAQHLAADAASPGPGSGGKALLCHPLPQSSLAPPVSLGEASAGGDAKDGGALPGGESLPRAGHTSQARIGMSRRSATFQHQRAGFRATFPAGFQVSSVSRYLCDAPRGVLRQSDIDRHLATRVEKAPAQAGAFRFLGLVAVREA